MLIIEEDNPNCLIVNIQRDHLESVQREISSLGLRVKSLFKVSGSIVVYYEKESDISVIENLEGVISVRKERVITLTGD